MLNYYKAGAATPDDAKNLSTVKQLAEAKGVTVYTRRRRPTLRLRGEKGLLRQERHHDGLPARRLIQRTPITMGGSQECRDRSYCKAGSRRRTG